MWNWRPRRPRSFARAAAVSRMARSALSRNGAWFASHDRLEEERGITVPGVRLRAPGIFNRRPSTIRPAHGRQAQGADTSASGDWVPILIFCAADLVKIWLCGAENFFCCEREPLLIRVCHCYVDHVQSSLKYWNAPCPSKPGFFRLRYPIHI